MQRQQEKGTGATNADGVEIALTPADVRVAARGAQILLYSLHVTCLLLSSLFLLKSH